MKETQHHPWYYIRPVETIDSPALIIYADRVKKNIKTAIDMVGDVKRLRPHVKTHKSADVTRLMLEAGITKFKCATIAEAEMLGITGAPDVLLAYQLSGPKAERFVTLIKQYPSTHYSCLVDNIAIAKSLTELAGKNKLRISVFIDLNVGMNRTGMTPDESAVSLFEQVANMNGLVPVGLHVYDGHISDADLERRTQRSNESFKQAMEVKDRLHEKGYGQIIVVAGGSPTFPIHASRPDVECSPGTFVYWDAGYAQTLSEQPFVPAALLITRIVSSPGQGLVCTDLGHKSVAAENPLERRVQFLNAPDVAFVSQSEEHLVLKMHNDHSLSVGDVLYGMPVHICPTCALYERAVVIEDGEIIGEWKMIARDRQINV